MNIYEPMSKMFLSLVLLLVKSLFDGVQVEFRQGETDNTSSWSRAEPLGTNHFPSSALLCFSSLMDLNLYPLKINNVWCVDVFNIFWMFVWDSIWIFKAPHKSNRVVFLKYCGCLSLTPRES